MIKTAACAIAFTVSSMLLAVGAVYGQANVERVTSKVAYAEYLAALRAGGQAMPSAAPGEPLPDSIEVTWERPIPREKSLAPVAAAQRAVVDLSRYQPAATVAAAASPSTLIAGLTFDDNATLASTYNVPPDPHGAAGPSHVCHVVNVAIQCHTTAGSSVLKQSLKTFFVNAVSGTANDPQTNTFDPKILYDQFESRWVVITLEVIGRGDANASNDESYVFIAVSATTDPTGTWYGQRIDTKVDISGTNYWFDYPGFGVDEDVVYVMGNMFSFPADASNGSRLAIIEKDTASGLYSGSTSTTAIHDPAGDSGAILTTGYQVAHVYGTGPTIVGVDFGTFLIGYSSIQSG